MSRIHTLDWGALREPLRDWHDLPTEARQALARLKGERLVPAAEFGPYSDVLIELGLLTRGADGSRVRAHVRLRPVSVAVRTALRTTILADGSEAALRRYIQATLDMDTREILLGEQSSRGDVAATLAHQAASPAWLDEALQIAAFSPWSLEYEPLSLVGKSPIDAEVREALPELIELLSRDPSRSFLDVAEELDWLDERAFGRVMRAALACLAIFPTMDPEEMVLRFGLHPMAQTRSVRTPVVALETRPLETTPMPAWLESDLSQLLSLAGTGELLVKTDWTLYKKSAAQLAAALVRTPDEADSRIDRDTPGRVDDALRTADEFSFARLVRAGRTRRLDVTDAGRAWMGLSRTRRIAQLIESVRPGAFGADALNPDDAVASARKDLGRLAAPAIGWDYQFGLPRASDAHALLLELRALLRAIPSEGAISLPDLMSLNIHGQNPLTGKGPGGRAVRLTSRTWVGLTDDDLEGLWYEVIASALAAMTPLGCLAFADVVDGERFVPWVSLTPAGRFFVGLDEQLQLDVEARDSVVVQPDFDVVFLQPSADVEAEIAPYCDRVGQSAGVVFRITQASIMRAAAAGADVAGIVAAFEAVSSRGLPKNVRTEIGTWHARVTHARVQRPLVIHCPDEATADRIESRLAKSVRRLGRCDLAVVDGLSVTRLADQCRELGVMLDIDTGEDDARRGR